MFCEIVFSLLPPISAPNIFIWNKCVSVLREIGDIRLFITLVPKVLLKHWLNNFGDLLNFDWFFTFQPLIVIYIRNNFVYNHWGCTSNLSAIVLSILIPGMYWLSNMKFSFFLEKCHSSTMAEIRKKLNIISEQILTWKTIWKLLF